MGQPPLQPPSPESAITPRINTQIHRRKKAKALSPLLDEWDESASKPPTHLRLQPASVKDQSETDNG